MATGINKALAMRGRVGADPLTTAEIAETPETDGQLKVQSINFHGDKNQSAHHTNQYECSELVVRRGKDFDLGLTLAKPYDPAAGHTLTFELWWGSKSSDTSTTHVVVPITGGEGGGYRTAWTAKVAESQGTTLTVRVCSPADCLIGRYKVGVCTKVGGANPFRFVSDNRVYLLFNPWCKDDEVYMEDDEQRTEYVLNDMGMYFYGSDDYVGHSSWYFGQFEEGILECVVGMLERSLKRPSSYSNPVRVSRLLSALVNAQDEDGILVGNWSGDYSGGTEPTAWSGSASIFEEYIRTGRPVCYGQCWVFGGLLTTALRAVGIPGRTVTNFSSAHDVDANCLIDYHFDAEGNPLDTDDSVWNFHVWNDAWMARPDLPKGYGGWQAVDSTPQELSDYIYRTGPSPHAAIKNGHVYLSYDTKFVFAEVNACKVKWRISKDPSEPPKMISLETNEIGTRVLTKAVGKMERQDITLQYKPSEGSVLEYISLFAADTHVDELRKLVAERPPEDTSLELRLPAGDVLIGEDLTVKAVLRKTCAEARRVNLSLTCHSMYYTGVKSRVVLQSVNFVDVTGEEAVHEWNVKASDYLPYLVDQAHLKFFVGMLVSDTYLTVTKAATFRLTKPEVDVQVPPTVPVEAPFKVTVKLTNPLSTTLQGCFFHLEGPAVALHKKEAFRNIEGNEMIEFQGTVSARKTTGVKELLVSFSSYDLIGVSGKAFVVIV